MRRIPLILSVTVFLMGPLLDTSPPVASQPAPASLAGITVPGVGRASAPAETATLVLMIDRGYAIMGEGQYGETKPVMPPQGPSPVNTPDMTPEEAAAPVVEALVAAGVPDSDINIVSNPYAGTWSPYDGPVSMQVRVELASPTTEQISSLLDAALAAAFEADLFVTMSGAVYGIEDCAELERQAREAAIADAREQAEIQAGMLNVSLGDVIASRDDPYAAMMLGGTYSGTMPLNSCSPFFTDQGMSIMYGAAPFDPYMPAEVTIQAHVELTFEMVPLVTATPAS